MILKEELNDPDSDIVDVDFNSKANVAKRQVWYNCNDDKELFAQYEQMVNEDNVKWSDILLMIQHPEYEPIIEKAIHGMMLKGFSKADMVEPLSLYYKRWGFSKYYCIGSIKNYIEKFGPMIHEFRLNRHLFTDKDIQLDLNMSPEYDAHVKFIVEKYVKNEYTFDRLILQFQILMIKAGYSNNFIEYTLNNFIRAMIEDEDMDMDSSGEEQNDNNAEE